MTVNKTYPTLRQVPLTLVFAGQASGWEKVIAQAVEAGHGTYLHSLLQEARVLLAPLAKEVATAVTGASQRLEELVTEVKPTTSVIDITPAVSMPAITLTQIALVEELVASGISVSETQVIGHSQGALGADIIAAYQQDSPALRQQELAKVVAQSLLLGTALATSLRQVSPENTASQMLSVRGLCETAIREGLTQINQLTSYPVSLAVKNNSRHFILSGTTEDLTVARNFFNTEVTAHNEKITAKLKGGSLLQPIWDELPVAAPFHNELLAEAKNLVTNWAQKLAAAAVLPNLENAAQALFLDHFDWVQTVSEATASKERVLLCLGPGKTVLNLVTPLVEGKGLVVVDGTDFDALDKILIPGAALPAPTVSWDRFTPQLLELPSGEVVVETAFTKLTGNSPIILAGMTPTTVNADIVAAAANAGFWAEMAGGGQYSAEVFEKNKADLVSQLEPGRSAQFNSMFFDRYMWNLQFGAQRIVSKARLAGAPINGVTVSAGIPEVEEATQLLDDLTADGFPYVCFKPGTVEQIHNVLKIAAANQHRKIIMQVEDGHAGGHHSWENLDDLLIATYAQIRKHENVILLVGGGIGTPQLAAHYLLGIWSEAATGVRMPVDGILVGTAAMVAKEAKTSPAVKQLLVDTPGITLAQQGGWVGKGQLAGGMTSGLSHLHADLYEVANDSAACSKLLAEVGSDISEINSRRAEIIAALNKTAKPYFGEVTEMTYAQWAQRVVDLAFPWADPTWSDRFFDLLQRIEARLHPADKGEIETLFASVEAVEDGPAALEKLLAAYPSAHTTMVGAKDAAWFIRLCRKHHKPFPFVPVIDADVARWWGLDTLWQSQDARYPAESVRIIAGPVSVAGITEVDEPIAHLLGRFESACVASQLSEGAAAKPVFSRLSSAADAYSFLRGAPHLVWNGHLIDNPAHTLAEEACSIVETEAGFELVINCDTYWDDLPEPHPYAVKHVRIPVDLPDSTYTGASPVVSRERLPEAVYELLAGVAGIGAQSVGGDQLQALPLVTKAGEVTPDGVAAHLPFGTVSDVVSLNPQMFATHFAATGQRAAAGNETQLDRLPNALADALVGPCWPSIYAALGSAHLPDGYPVIEGLLNAVHLDHCVSLEAPLEEIVKYSRLLVRTHTSELEESSSGRIVSVNVALYAPADENSTQVGELLVTMLERFAIRGRITSAATPSAAAGWGGKISDVAATPRKFIRRALVKAPADMTAFAIASGDYNPIHTSERAAGLVSLAAPLVHGMWLSATAQAVALAGLGKDEVASLQGWSYSMYGMVQLEDEVEIIVERVGKRFGAAGLEVTCRIGENVVSRATALLAAPRVAYVYPGQGIQSVGMGAADRVKSAAAKAVWERADAYTLSALGFSIRQIVEQNPTEITVKGTVLRHPQGVLNLTQFTQVALAVVAYAQTARLAEEGALVPGAIYAGHSLGEYTALASCANIFDLEAVIAVVYSRGSAMHTLVPRDAQGRSNYRLGALRPDQCGVSATEVVDFVAKVAQESNEFLQIVNFNLAGQQYAVAGTVRGLEALEAAALEAANAVGGKRPFMTIPGIDVPFHSSVLRDGVQAFAQTLDETLPAEIDVEALVGRYIPNLVAQPFALTRQFAQAILDTVPAVALEDLLAEGDKFEQLAENEPGRLARILLLELLSWQFASPVRWIETQDLLLKAKQLGGLEVSQIIEVGLASAPTLANLATKTLNLPAYQLAKVVVRNVERDEASVYASDALAVPAREIAAADMDLDTTSVSEDASSQAASEATSAAETAPTVEETPSAPSAPASGGTGSALAAPSDINFDPEAALLTLIALQTKLRLEQIGATDTADSITNGVSSRRNQLLMDMAAELGVPSLDGAAEADIATICQRANQAAPTYQPFGSVLGELVRAKLRPLVAGVGLKPTAVAERISEVWKLPASWICPVEAQIVLETRVGESVRGGTLGTLAELPTGSKAQVFELIDAAVQQVANRQGVSVAKAGGGSAGGTAVVDSQALNAFAEQVTGESGVLAAIANTIATKLGLQPTEAPVESEDFSALVTAVEAELGPKWLQSVTPAFTNEKVVLFDDRWAVAREELARAGAQKQAVDPQRFTGLGETVARHASWWAKCTAGEVSEAFAAASACAATEFTGRYRGEIALVTGASPGSIAYSVVESLLAEGATVVMTTSRLTPTRVDLARQLYANHAAAGSALYVVEANLSSFRDVDAVVDWISTEQTQTRGNQTVVTKPALLPTLVFPFAAPSVYGSLADVGGVAEAQARLLLWSVERLIAKLAERIVNTVNAPRAHIVLPGSPNRGTFGGDGAYGEVKAAFDAILNKWQAESGWVNGVTLAQARIGWVRGTHLMGGNDALVPAAQAAGIHVYTPAEITRELLALCSEEAKVAALEAPLDVDLTGGLATAQVSLPELAKTVQAQQSQSVANALAGEETFIRALPNVPSRTLPASVPLGEVTASLEDMVVVVGAGEVSAWGSARTRLEAELGIERDGSVALTAAGVLELAWMMGLVSWNEDPAPGWYDAKGSEVPEELIFERFHDEVVARCGVRSFPNDSTLIEGGSNDVATIYLDKEITFTVDSETEALEYQLADPATQIANVAGEWQVTKPAGTVARVPKRATLSRTVGGALPTGFNPANWGIPANMVDSLDRIAVWNLVTTVDAFLSSGFTPAELLQAIHPLDVASTQGTGIGGMESLRQVFLSRFLGEDRPQDILQEALPNVVAAHVMQAYVGGYGAMIHPVAACATAAVSIEEAVDKIRVGKAQFVVAGGIDDISVESLTGFGDMNATAHSQQMADKGILERFYSRANDRRRGGFVEAAGGGTVLLARGDVAAQLGLPVLAVVAHAASYSDGAHTSIPAPGIGALGAARGGSQSPLARSLRSLGLTPDDVRVISKHDTSTNANDPNESELHTRLWPAIGRSVGNPLFVISQKSLTGHAKGGAALFQVAGLLEVLASGVIPGNAALDCVDPEIAPKATDLVWLRTPLALGVGSVKAAALTSLGFGHVAALVVLAHSSAFEVALAQAGFDVEVWRQQANARLNAGVRRLEAGMLGRAALYEQPASRRLPAVDAHGAEVSLLLNAETRLGADGVYPL
ncbi:DUF1729 domain-containing protein [Gleimia sp. 6138-11-ORH1]|uniref:type I polyketide synthase n=1 Tax=Gleimia sp. 6138-11-ORH1 TaxID=2973937 RepID=UPI002166C176|nr:type I polyketide synthase [Gleimia sp. 6138-11-ORH1]MCS4484610.1 DUF1729 domain-containing protein [Gleimia sp. 6138-11-ORH1]